MAPDTDSATTVEPRDGAPLWAGRVSLTRRILAVNIFALAMLAGGFFYLDSYRARLVDDRLGQAEREVRILADSLDAAMVSQEPRLLVGFGATTEARVRTYAPDGRLTGDSWTLSGPNYRLIDPAEQRWEREAARYLDRIIDAVVGAERPPPYAEPAKDDAGDWPELVAAKRTHHSQVYLRRAPDRTHMISAAAPIGRSGALVLTTANARDIVRTVRAERLRLGIVLALVTIVSILLSLFLARTIVRPLRRLARAAVRVRLGRAREVVVPRLPSRRDEIGLLARAVSDMSHALNQRIDAIEAFAADVTHELKNPLASLGSALEALDRVKDPALAAQLLGIARADVRRLDRLITDVSDASRIDAQLARARFEPVDLGAMIESIVGTYAERGVERGVRMAFARPRVGVAVVMGEDQRLARVVQNLVDNAISFSPDGGLVQISATRVAHEVIVSIEDEGPGVPQESREAVFRRFHSERPPGEEFGRHSGLGLAIAKTIMEGHGGRIDIEDRRDGRNGAHFAIRLPAATTGEVA
ncbi:ATP-binding protein [Sphingomonas sanxanigenens]|uniref:histidine kinase n=1 Tax=Sphingomonas sanxanigenens DSM 19645 = NX02 TaxID=1123269 RepID=W0AEU0_9SPHN|nr:ATP-binding protein [Sphingomonas sanxanigenens]AHE54185.1 hypothetical protein NX02_12420 [Sphingomonas sanxanigenens DSM 19645 = NX02]